MTFNFCQRLFNSWRQELFENTAEFGRCGGVQCTHEVSPSGGKVGGLLLEEPLLEGVEGVDPALELGGGGAALQLQLPGVHHGAEDGQAPGSDILATVLQAPSNRHIIFKMMVPDQAALCFVLT